MNGWKFKNTQVRNLFRKESDSRREYASEKMKFERSISECGVYFHKGHNETERTKACNSN